MSFGKGFIEAYQPSDKALNALLRQSDFDDKKSAVTS